MAEDPLFRRIRLHAEKRLQFELDCSPGERLHRLKEFLRLENEMLERYHRKGDSGLRVACARSIMMDVLIVTLYNFAIKKFEAEKEPLPCPISLIALGGYGRQEMCPFSDVDLMFLYPDKVKPNQLKAVQEALTDQLLYPMWDLKLKVGHSSRTVKETIEEAKSEIQSKNALLESRPICGDESLYQTFRTKFERFYQKSNHLAYALERLKDQATRRAKYGGTVFLQEPDIKNGVGGLRDYHNILWMAQVRLNVKSLDELVDLEIIEENDCRQLLKAYDFLLRARNELHFQSNRPTDVINLEKQPRIAWSLGYRQKDIFKRVEAFTRDYYRHANKIYLVSKTLEQRFAFSKLKENDKLTFKNVLISRRKNKQKEFDGFFIQDGNIHQDDEAIFETDRGRLIRIFRYSQQHSADIALELKVLISKSINLINHQVIRDPSVNKTFRSILQQKGNVYPILSEMHELGVLGRFIPEFGKLTCMVQHEYYHRYTADVHVLNTIKQLDAVFNGEGEFFRTYQHELRQTDPPSLLYLILLLHDIGKAVSIKDHSDIGLKIAVPILNRLGVIPQHHEIILSIIKNHLEMARFWQRYDLDDTRTTESFAQLVGDEETLRYLFVHTYCDARGTANSLWNSYKESLHQRLFYNTLEHLKNKHSLADRQKEKKDKMEKDFLNKKIPGVAKEEIEAHFNLLPERYFLHYSSEEVELHVNMINQLLKTISEADSIGSLIPIINWHDDLDQGFTVINIVTWDRSGLFYKLAGALTVAGLNILSTKAISRSDHITIDTFYVVNESGTIVQDKDTREVFKKHVEDTLLRNKDLLPAIANKAKKKDTSSPLMQATDRLKAPIPPTVEVYHELSLRRTIIEVQANDHIGLLYQLAKAIFDHGYDITFARVSTERGAALDTFYIENINPAENGKTEAPNLIPLRDTLDKIIASEEFLAVG